jgi:hypothetical protein
MSIRAVPDEGNNQPDENAAVNLAATRTLEAAADELSFVFGKYGLGIALCIFGIAFAGFAIGLRDADPKSFDLPILLTIFGFATVVLVFGVFVAILRAEGSQKVTTTTPNLLDRPRSEVNTALAGTPLYLDASPATPPDSWIAVSQYPQANQSAPTGSRVQVVFAGQVPPLNNLTRSVVESTLSACNLTLSPQPANAAANSIAQNDQDPTAGSPPPRDRAVTVSFQ